MSETTECILIIGYGNPGRLDDGLGPALAIAIAARSIPGVTVETGYQLQVEDAAEVADYDTVVFADADTEGDGPFSLRPLAPKAVITFSTHALAPEAVLALSREEFGATTAGFVLAIRGYEFNEFGERLSEGARANLAVAVDYLEAALRHQRVDEAVTGPMIESTSARLQ